MDPKSLPRPSLLQTIQFMTPEARRVMLAYARLMHTVAPTVKITWAL